MEKVLPWIIVAIVVIVAFYLFNQNKKATATAIANSIPIAPACVPFTKAQQDAEKTAKRSQCAGKLLVPFVGQVQYYNCLKQIEVNLTPINNC